MIARNARSIPKSLFFAIALVGCNADLYEGVSRTHDLEVPSFATFRHVDDAMQLHCATLDCHGQVGRNLRLYGQYGLRLDANDDPLGAQTSDAEYQASYWSIVGLEPEIMSSVVGQRAAPTALAMVRKPRGIEKHKGGQLMNEGDDLDRCIVGWLTNQFEVQECDKVAQTQRPVIDGGP